jgi:hypothetical protein
MSRKDGGKRENQEEEAGGASEVAPLFERFLLPFGRPRGRFPVGFRSASASGPVRLMVIGEGSVGEFRRRSLRYLSK